MTYDEELTLITRMRKDAMKRGDEDLRETVMCCVKSVTRSEFYGAGINNLRPEIVFVVHRFEYNNQREVEYNGLRYAVIRCYDTGFEETELIAERKTANVVDRQMGE